MCRHCENPKYQHLPKCSCGKLWCKKNRKRLGYGNYHKPQYEPQYKPHEPQYGSKCGTGYCPKPNVYAPKHKDKCPEDLCCAPKQTRAKECDLHSNYTPADITVVTCEGHVAQKNISTYGLLPKRSKDFAKTVCKCLRENEKRVRCKGKCHCGKCKDFVVNDDRYNIPVCEKNKKCVTVELNFLVGPHCEEICGTVKFEMSSSQKVCKTTSVTDLCPTSVLAESPTGRKQGNFFKLVWNDVPIGGDYTKLSFKRVPLSCKEKTCGNDYADSVCITQICIYE